MWHVYILRCSDGSLYVGHTSDLDARLARHNEGRASGYTTSRRPVTLAFHETIQSETAAVARERQLKGWSRAKKDALILGDTEGMRFLAKRRRRSPSTS